MLLLLARVIDDKVLSEPLLCQSSYVSGEYSEATSNAHLDL